MRITVEVVPAEPHLLEQRDHALGQLGPRGLAIDAEGAPDEVDDEVPRVQRRERILKHHLAIAPESPHLAALEQIDAVPPLDLAERGVVRMREQRLQPGALIRLEVVVDAAAGRLGKAAHTAAERALAAAALADEPDGLAAPYVEADAVHGADVTDHPLKDTLADGIILFEVADREQEVARPRRGLGRSRLSGDVHAVLVK